jgi:hypothetical protein
MGKIRFAWPLLCAAITAFSPAFGQTLPFVKSFPAAYGLTSVLQSSQGGYMAVGNEGQNTQFFLRFGMNAQGDTLWVKKDSLYNVPLNYMTGRWPVCAAAASDGGAFILCGVGITQNAYPNYTCSFNTVLRTNAQGDTIWNAVISSTDAYNGAGSSYLSATPDGGCVVVGASSAHGNFRIVKVDSIGTQSWESVIAGDCYPTFQSVCVSSDSGYIATGYNNGCGDGVVNLIAAKFSRTGTSIWTKIFYSGVFTTGDGKKAEGHSVVATSDGGCLISGYVSDSGTYGGSALLMRLNGSGDSLWTKTYFHSSDQNSSNAASAYTLAQLPSGQYLMFLDQHRGSSDSRPTILKLNASGDSLWSQIGYPYQVSMPGIDQAGGALLVAYAPAIFIKTTAGGLYVSPVLTSPDNGSVNAALSPSLAWSVGSPVQHVSSFRVQVASDSLFAKVAFDSSNVTGDSVQTGQLPASTRHFWRVQSFGKEGGPTQWSNVWSFTTGATSVRNTKSKVAIPFSLELNCPHPFNRCTTIRYSIPRASHVTLRVFNVLGEEVAQLVNKNLQPGRYETQWNVSGRSNTIFFFRLASGDASGESVSTKRLTLSK